MSLKSRFRLASNHAAPGSDRKLTFEPALHAKADELQFQSASKSGDVILHVFGSRLASKLEMGKDYFIEITPAT